MTQTDRVSIKKLTDKEKKQLVQAYQHAISNIQAIQSKADLDIVNRCVMPDLKETLENLGAGNGTDPKIRLDFEEQAGLRRTERPESHLDRAKETYSSTPSQKPKPKPKPEQSAKIKGSDLRQSIWETWLDHGQKLSDIDGPTPAGPLKGTEVRKIHQAFDAGRIASCRKASLYDLEDSLGLTELTLEKAIESSKSTWDKNGIAPHKDDSTPFTEGPLKGWISPREVHNELRAGCLERHGYRSIEELNTANDINVLNLDKIIIAAFLTWQENGFKQRPKQNDGFWQHGLEAGHKFTWEQAQSFLETNQSTPDQLEQLLDQAGIINEHMPNPEKLNLFGINIMKNDEKYIPFPAAKEEADPQPGKKKRRVISGASTYTFHPY